MHRTWLPRRSLLAALAGVACALSLTGCGKSDPLDERIDARTMNKFVRWQEKHVLPLGEPIVSEFGMAIAIIAQKTAGYKVPRTRQDFNSPYNTLCQRLDGWPLRSVIIEGYEMTNVSLRDILHLERTNTDVLRIRMNDEELELGRRIARAEAGMKRTEDRIRLNEARIRELQGTAPSS